MIVDGHHLADETVLLIWAAAAGRVALVTDATAGAAGNPGSYQLGDIEIEIADGGVPTREDGVMAGTVLTMIDAVRNLHALGISFEDAVGAASAVPARILGRSDLGVLEPGGPAGRRRPRRPARDRARPVRGIGPCRGLNPSCASSRMRWRA